MIVESYTAHECYSHVRYWLRDARISLGRVTQARSRDVRALAFEDALSSLVHAEVWRGRARRVRRT